ncbi:MAG: hypothetical protein J6S71_04070 [Clostridia bacterium]|nr:hypothetical protein [Clostridia bacterium]
MKKIFAFILATIMVMSLVPASVFAAITNDPGCPTVHTVNNCDYTVLGEVDATCTDPSYTAYKCNKCGKQFADKFGSAPLGHKLDKDNQNKDKKELNTDPNCATKTDGKLYVKCSVCGYVPAKVDDPTGKLNYEDGYVKVPYKHNLVAVSGVGCETLYKCTNSGCTHTETKAHTWQFTRVTLEPDWAAGKYIPGEALFTCKTCKDTKTVQILNVACEHDDASKVLVSAAVAPTCTEKGAYAVYKCADCNQLFKLVDKEYIAIAKAEEAVRDNNGGHTPKKDKDGKPITVTNGCTVTYTCDKCGETVVNTDNHPANLIEVQGSTPATCTTWGYTYKLCKACGVVFLEKHKPTEHDTITYNVASTCATPGATYVLCCNANCPMPTAPVSKTENKKVYNKQVSVTPLALDADGHKLYTTINGVEYTDKSKVPGATCDQSAVYIWMCKNGCSYIEVDQKIASGHDPYIGKESHNCGKGTATLNAWTTRLYSYCKNCNYGANDSVYTDVINANQQTAFSSKSEAELFHGIAFKLTDKDGKVTYEYRAGKDAKTLKFVKSVAASCTYQGYDLYTCDDCAAPVYVINNKGGHVELKKVAEVKPTECKKTGTLAHSICALCNAAYVENADGSQTTLTSTVIAAHSYYGEIKETNCSKVTYWECECGKTFTDKTATQSYTVPDDAHAWKDIVPGSPATCNLAGVAKVKYCTACKLLEVNRVYLNTKTNKKTTIYLAKTGETFNGKQITVTLTNGAQLVIEKDGTVKDNKANNTTLAVAKLEHKYPDGTNAIKPSTDPSAANADHTKVNYTHEACDFCDYEYLTNYFPATGGHKNAAGQTLTNKCDNSSVKDRVCVVCLAAGKNTTDATITINHNWQKFGKENYQDVPATCVDEGYRIQYCVDCGYRKVSNIVGINSKNHADPVGLKANYAQNGYSEQPCAACGFAGKTNNTMKDKKGLEVLLSYDVNGHESDYAALGSIITVTVDLGSLNGVKVWGGNFEIAYNPSVLEFVKDSASFSNEIGFNTRLATDVLKPESYFDMTTYQMVYTGKMIPAGTVNIAVQADNENISIKGTKNLLTLQFKVVGAVESGYYSTQISVAKESVDFIDETGKALTNVIYNETNFVKGDKDTDGIELVEIFDIKVDGDYKMDDALEIYTYILFNEYDAAADINADGKIDAEDLRIFYAVLTGATTIADYFKPATEESGSGSSQIQPRA